jgi:hypothetical protein
MAGSQRRHLHDALAFPLLQARRHSTAQRMTTTIPATTTTPAPSAEAPHLDGRPRFSLSEIVRHEAWDSAEQAPKSLPALVRSSSSRSMMDTRVGNPPLAVVTSDGLCTRDSVTETGLSVTVDLAVSGVACAPADVARPMSRANDDGSMTRASRRDILGAAVGVGMWEA